MPQVDITIGGRTFDVACQDGEEPFLHAAAKILDAEAAHLADQLGRITEARMLLMAGLMLADKSASFEDQIKALTIENANLRNDLAAAKNLSTPAAAAPSPDQAGLLETLVIKAEGLADQLDPTAKS